MNCPKCNTPLKEGVRYCTECGEAVSQRKKCFSCGAEISEAALFCTNCGIKQEQTEIVALTDLCNDKLTTEVMSAESSQEGNNEIPIAKAKRPWGFWFVVSPAIIAIIFCIVYIISEMRITSLEEIAYKREEIARQKVMYKKEARWSAEEGIEKKRRDANYNKGGKIKPAIIGAEKVKNSEHIAEYLTAMIEYIYDCMYHTNKLDYICVFSRNFRETLTYADELAIREEMIFMGYDIWTESYGNGDISVAVKEICFINSHMVHVKYVVKNSHGFAENMTEKVAVMIIENENAGWCLDDLYSEISERSEKKYAENFIYEITGSRGIPQKRVYNLYDNESSTRISLKIDSERITGECVTVAEGQNTSRFKLKGRVDENGAWRIGALNKSESLGTFYGHFYLGTYCGTFWSNNGKKDFVLHTNYAN